MTLAISLPTAPDPNIPQQRAAIPEHDVWVAASAGSGKTKVLTDRVLRLLLPDPEGRWSGAAPHKILCITFTKAAAALMALRVQKKLGDWAVMTEDELRSDLQKLLGVTPNDVVMQAARTLFSAVLDTPGGLAIMTIHAFCQSTLGRFAIEAGVTPGFSILEESRAHDILRRIVDDVIRAVEDGHTPELEPSYKRIATYLDLDSLRDTLLHVMSKSREVTGFLSAHTDMRAALLDYLGHNAALGLDVSDTDLRTLALLMTGKGGKVEKELGQGIADWLALSASDRIENLAILQNAFLTQKGMLRSPTKAIADNHPEFFVLRDAAIAHITAYLDNQARARQAEQTADLLQMVAICLDRYTARKKELNALDFNDLILKTRTLLESVHLDWVHFKLDEGIDHILVDEAQDTNIHQWEIIRHLSDDFLSGQGDDRRMRSLFVVGDEKQSIFSFHGADPDAFQIMRDFFADRSRAAERVFDPVRLETSFRSARPVLQLVDAVFARPDLAARLGLAAGHTLTHYSFRPKAAGLVEIWPPFIRPKADTKNQEIAWVLPPVSTTRDGQDNGGTSSPLARKIALTISGWLQKGELLPSAGRAIEPRDILVLVRTRTGFVPDLVRQLKILGVAVSGVDRMKLTDQMAVMDCLALARFARLPEDDLSLACLLRSPFIRMDEDALMTLALSRSGSLWDAVQSSAPPAIIDWLRHVIATSRVTKPFDFFDDVLNGICPFENNSSGWHAFTTCLGTDCLDPLDEFLSYCLAKEADGVFSLEELISLLQASPIEIKRDTESGDKDSLNQVRIMTVHASKGLEAPIVFLPDTLSVPNRRKIDALQWIQGKDLSIPLWAAKSADGCAAYQTLKDAAYDKMISEHMRLLYVALTRPQDRLYIMGESTSETLPEYSWYKLAADGFATLPCTQIGDILRYETSQDAPPKDKDHAVSSPSSAPPLPAWAFTMAPDDRITPLRTIQPSRLQDEDEQVRSPRDTTGQFRFRRGILTHKLFQILPDLPVLHREAAARRFLDRMGHDLPPAVRDDIVSETLNILTDPVFAPVFGEGSLAEVPVSGDLGDGRMISGQIDRLIIGHNQIMIVDFKTNRPSPTDESAIPAAYKNQLRAYKTALSRIYPAHNIVCALLWTDQPRLMPVSI